jgi:hypothetical protein
MPTGATSKTTSEPSATVRIRSGVHPMGETATPPDVLLLAASVAVVGYGASAMRGERGVGTEKRMSRLSPSRRHHLEPVGVRKRWWISRLTGEIRDTTRLQSESRRCRVLRTALAETGSPQERPVKRESGASIRAVVAGSTCGERSGHRHGDAVSNTGGRVVRNNWASNACKPARGTSKSASETSGTVRIRAAANRESGALIRTGLAGGTPWRCRRQRQRPHGTKQLRKYCLQARQRGVEAPSDGGEGSRSLSCRAGRR